MSSSSNPLLEAKGITKYFGTITALENVNLKVHAGECLGVVGDNGAGKSTLMKVLSGLYKPSAGSLFFQGKEEILESPRDSQNLGFLKLLDFNKIKELTNAHLDKLKINVKSADQKVEELSGGQRQAVAIARSTAFNAKVVIMDEPTAALAIKEVGKVLDLINSLKKTGVGVIVISHRMDDIFTVCDRVMALFQGTNFAEASLSSTSRDEVIGWIMGKK